MGGEAEPFRNSFERLAKRVRSRHALRRGLLGATLGLLSGALLALLFWAARLDALRAWSALAGLVGMGAGLFMAKRRAWSERDLALYLDACLDARETISTALDLETKPAEESPTRRELLLEATKVLDSADLELIQPRLFERSHLGLPVAALTIALLAWLPARALPSPPPDPGSSKLELAEVPGLQKIEALSKLDARDGAQRERLDALAKEARDLREQLAKGMEKREAQADIARLRDAILAERLSLGDSEQRAGFEAAIGRLTQDGALRDAAKALGDRDLRGFDEALEKLANERERRDRTLAREALEEAAELARREGAKDVAEMLEDARERMKRQEARAELLRELAEALGEEVQAELDAFDADPDAMEDLADALGRALERLSPEERERLAERLKDALPSLESGPRETLEDWAEHLATEEGLEELVEQLRRLANEELRGEEAERQEALEDAERGAAEAEGQIGGLPVPMAGAPPSKGGDQPSGPSGQGSSGDDEAGSGPGEGGGEAKKGEGSTVSIEGEGLRSRAQGRIDKSVPMAGVAAGLGKARSGEVAKELGVGALPMVGPEELSGSQRSEIPEEYREQVGRYFQP